MFIMHAYFDMMLTRYQVVFLNYFGTFAKQSCREKGKKDYSVLQNKFIYEIRILINTINIFLKFMQASGQVEFII